MDELDLTSVRSKAAYERIKDYVLKHMGLKVSSLYISQVKQKRSMLDENQGHTIWANMLKRRRKPKCIKK